MNTLSMADVINKSFINTFLDYRAIVDDQMQINPIVIPGADP